jgi:hypothetical protein
MSMLEIASGAPQCVGEFPVNGIQKEGRYF